MNLNNLLLFIQLLIILTYGMKLGILMYKKEFKFEFYTDIVIVIIWFFIIFVSR